MKPIVALISCCAAVTAVAHDGHGPQGPHWHATDSFGFVVLVAVIAFGAWYFRRK